MSKECCYINNCLLFRLRIYRKSLRDNRPILRRPAETCYAAVNQDIIILLVLEEDQKLHNSIVLRSYLAKKGKRCPIPGCNHVVLLESGDSIYQFTCKCHYRFCYKCLKEPHHPICCALVEIWRREPLKQSRKWQIAYIRNCPKCNQSLEAKNWSKQMQCSVCSFNFCWTCLGSWFKNGHGVGEKYSHICPSENLSEGTLIKTND
ncbi:putative E3 ubiquitin-protein ligase ARI8 isoform X1 [Silene latifolia]|uniref:putative E3 ubiquitin-protein ligase ARI8 isoform X1 n=1 Tax=Silene latifolia TaxID=37657 RepID=UPI003D77E1B0